MVGAEHVGLFYVALALVPAVLALVSFSKRDRPGALPLIVAGLGASGAGLAHGGRLLGEGFDAAAGYATVATIAFDITVTVAVLSAFFLAVEYTGRRYLQDRRLVLGLGVVGLGFALGNGLQAGGVAVPVAWLFIAGDTGFTVVVSLLTLWLFAHQYVEARGLYKTQSGALFVGYGIASLLGGIQTIVGPETVNLTPIGLAIAVVVFAWALFRYAVMETVPVARETLFEHVTDPVLAVDGEGHLVEFNEAAATLFGIGGDDVGRETRAVFHANPDIAEPGELPSEVCGVLEDDRRHFDPDHPAIAALHRGAAPPEEAVALVVDGERRHYRLTTSGLGEPAGRLGRLVVFREVTREKRREADLDLLKQVLTRVLRHNLRNDLTAIRGYARLLESSENDRAAELATEIVQTSDDLIETSQKARQIEEIIESDHLIVVGLHAEVTDVVERVRSAHPDAEIEVDVPLGLHVRVNPGIEHALENVIENGIIHNDEPTPTVRISAERAGPWVELEVSDDGPGIPSNELKTLERGEETALVHGSGTGLWLIYTAVKESDGEVDIDVADGTTVTLRLQAVAADATG